MAFNTGIAQQQQRVRGCEVCRQATDYRRLLICEGCEGVYHTYCVGLDSVPRSRWYCPRCKRSSPIGSESAPSPPKNAQATGPSSAVSALALSGQDSHTTRIALSRLGQAYPVSIAGRAFYGFFVNGVECLRRVADNYLFMTRILAVAGFEKTLQKRLLASMPDSVKEIVHGHADLQGTWIEYRFGVRFCHDFGLGDSMRPLFEHNLDPVNRVQLPPTRLWDKFAHLEEAELSQFSRREHPSGRGNKTNMICRLIEEDMHRVSENLPAIQVTVPVSAPQYMVAPVFTSPLRDSELTAAPARDASPRNIQVAAPAASPSESFHTARGTQSPSASTAAGSRPLDIGDTPMTTLQYHLHTYQGLRARVSSARDLVFCMWSNAHHTLSASDELPDPAQDPFSIAAHELMCLAFSQNERLYRAFAAYITAGTASKAPSPESEDLATVVHILSLRDQHSSSRAHDSGTLQELLVTFDSVRHFGHAVETLLSDLGPLLEWQQQIPRVDGDVFRLRAHFTSMMREVVVVYRDTVPQAEPAPAAPQDETPELLFAGILWPAIEPAAAPQPAATTEPLFIPEPVPADINAADIVRPDGTRMSPPLAEQEEMQGRVVSWEEMFINYDAEMDNHELNRPTGSIFLNGFDNKN